MTAVLCKHLNDELKTVCLLQFFPEVAQNSPRIPRVFHVQRNPWVFQVCSHSVEINSKLFHIYTECSELWYQVTVPVLSWFCAANLLMARRTLSTFGWAMGRWWTSCSVSEQRSPMVSTFSASRCFIRAGSLTTHQYITNTHFRDATII